MIKVSLYSSPCSTPFIFVRHAWFVIEENGQFERYELLHYKEKNPDYGYMSLDHLPPTYGIERVYKFNYGNWQGKLLGEARGEVAEKLASIIRTSLQTYPFKNIYRLFPGPNSNTYIQWVLDQVPKSGLYLPWNALGKNFPKH